MPHAHVREGKVLHFPPRLSLDFAGRYVAPGPAELAGIAATIAAKALPTFTRDLVMSARRHRYHPRWAELNRAGLVLARHCLDRMIAEGVDVPEAERTRAEGEAVHADAL